MFVKTSRRLTSRIRISIRISLLYNIFISALFYIIYLGSCLDLIILWSISFIGIFTLCSISRGNPSILVYRCRRNSFFSTSWWFSFGWFLLLTLSLRLRCFCYQLRIYLNRSLWNYLWIHFLLRTISHRNVLVKLRHHIIVYSRSRCSWSIIDLSQVYLIKWCSHFYLLLLLRLLSIPWWVVCLAWNIWRWLCSVRTSYYYLALEYFLRILILLLRAAFSYHRVKFVIVWR